MVQLLIDREFINFKSFQFENFPVKKIPSPAHPPWRVAQTQEMCLSIMMGGICAGRIINILNLERYFFSHHDVNEREPPSAN